MGGAENIMVSLFNNIDNNLFEPSFLAISNGSLKSRIRDQSRLTVLDHDSVKFGVFGFLQSVRKINPDIVFSTHSHLNALLCFFKKINIIKSKLVIRESNYLSIQQSNGKSLYEKYFITYMIKTFYHYADHLVCQSNMMRNDVYSFIPNYIVPASVIYNPIGNVPPYIAEETKRVIISIGRLELQKNHQLLIKAFDQVKNIISHDLLIIGDGSERNNLIKLIDEKDLKDRVHLKGFIENVWDEYCNSAVFVLSSDYEGFPNVILEAMANCTPVISANCPSGPNEIIQHGENGFLFKAGCADELARLMVRVVEDNSLQEKIKKNAYQCLIRYNIIDISKQYQNIFEKLDV
jgi:glycosyltransferase involved in cell wall biosynthesis